MTDQDIRNVLARMAGVEDAATPNGVLTPARALRLSLARAVEGAAGLKIAVQSVTDDSVVLEEAAAAAAHDDLVLGLWADGALIGAVLLDRELRSALVEAQTMGRLSTMPAPDRPVSVADAALSAPVIDAFLVELDIAAAPTSLSGWTRGVVAGPRLDGGRGIGLKLPEALYRMCAMGVDLGVPDREGQMTVVLPHQRSTTEEEPPTGHWGAALERAVMGAPAALDAVIYRRKLPLARVQGLRAGDLLPLDGASLTAIRLEGSGGTVVANARLGQVGGMKAVRLQAAPVPVMTDAVHPAPRASRALGIGRPAAAATAGGDDGEGAGWPDEADGQGAASEEEYGAAPERDDTTGAGGDDDTAPQDDYDSAQEGGYGSASEVDYEAAPAGAYDGGSEPSWTDQLGADPAADPGHWDRPETTQHDGPDAAGDDGSGYWDSADRAADPAGEAASDAEMDAVADLASTRTPGR